MKGQNRIKRGSSFKGIVSYCLDHDDARVLTGNISSKSENRIVAEFVSVSSFRSDIEKPVWHNSLRLPKGEKISDEKWQAIATDYTKKMGLEKNQWIAIKHDSTDGEHIHIIANRIRSDSTVYLGQNENLKSAKIIIDLEKKHGLQVTKAVEFDQHGQMIRPDKSKISKNEIEQSIRTGKAPVRQQLQMIIDEAKKGGPDIFEFIERVEAAGAAAKPNVAKTGKMNGFSFSLDDVAFSATKLGAKYKWAKMSKEIIYEQARDSEELISRAIEIKDREDQNSGGNVRTDIGDEQVIDRPDRSKQADDQSNEASNGEASVRSRSSARLSTIDQGDSERSGQGTEQISERFKTRGESSQVPSSPNHISDHVDKLRSNVSDLEALSATAIKQKRTSSNKLDANNNKSKLRGSSKTDSVTKRAIARTVERLAVDHFVVSIQKNGKGAMTFELTADQMLEDKFVGKLKSMNVRHNNIYIRPDEKFDHGLVLIDDVDQSDIEKMIEDGRSPVLTVETSPGNWQAWIDLGESATTEERKLIARKYAREYDADIGSADGRHNGRLPGFTNRKPDHQNKIGLYPFVATSLNNEPRPVATKAVKDDLEQARFLIEKEEANKRRTQAEQISDREALSLSASRNINKRFTGKLSSIIKRYPDTDWSRADFMIAKDLIREGYKAEQIEQVIKEESAVISDRKAGHIDDYCMRTVNAASTSIEKDRAEQSKEQSNAHDLTM